MPDLVGATLGRYQVTALVGQGGMATVYKALDPALDRAVAIKVMHTHLAVDPAFVGRFRHEAKAVAALRHPNIVKVFDFGDQAGAYYMVMEFIDGPTLGSLLETRAGEKGTPTGSGPGIVSFPGGAGSLTPPEVLRIFPPLCSAIDYATTRGMMHRDIKPANILLTQEGEPVLTDYGIAKIMGATSYTASGVVMGSAHYMSPEQVQGLPTDHRTDIYSLGVVLFEALVGRVPFDADTTASILAQHITAPVPSVQSINPQLPIGMQAVLEKALAKEPEKRYQQADEMAAALQTALVPPAPAGVPPTSPVSAGQEPTVVVNAAAPTRMEPVITAAETSAEPVWGLPGYPGQLEKKPRRWPLIAAVAAIVVIGGVVAGVLVGTSGDKPAGSTDLTLPGSAGSTTGPGETFTTVPGGGTSSTVSTAQVAALIADGDTLVDSGRFDEGIAKYQDALRLDPNNEVGRTQLGIAYYLQSDTTETAENELELVTATNPSSARAWAFLGLLRLLDAYSQRSGDFSSAEQACETALAIDPQSAVAHAFLGRVYAASGRKDEASASMDQALAIAPEDPWVLESAGWTNGVQGDWTAAVPHYRLAATYRPNWAAFLSVLAEALRETGEYDEALGFYQTMIQLDQGYEESAYEGIGVTLWQKGDTSGAITNLEKALALDDTNDYAHWALGAILDEEGDYEAALPHLQRAVALVPNNAGYQEWLGDCYYNLGRYEEAKAAVDTSLRLDPSRPSAQRLRESLKAVGY